MSAIRHVGTPILLIDCESTDGSFEHFADLMNKYSFDLLSAPLRQHGETLDWLFREVPDRKLLLVDSDLEIRDPWLLTFFRDYIDEEQTFGCGFVVGPGWITDHPGTSIDHAYYQERCWMPLALLKVAPVREAIRAGHSFVSSELFNDFAPSYRISRWMKSVRDRYPALGKKEAPRVLRLFRTSFYGHRPSLVVYDTGA